MAGRGDARVQPIWAEDVAACAIAALARPPARFELAGPETMTVRHALALALRARGHERRLLPVPLSVLRPVLRAYQALAGPTALVTWEEVLQQAITMTTPRGTADAEALGVRPRAMAEVYARS
jgi:uncharacterized protein YbjT (DUF2867 family)